MTQNGTGLMRPRFFDRQRLRAADLTAGQDYLRERLRRHNRFLHGFGVVGGAEVIAVGSEDYPWLVSISEGYVVTPGGDEVYLPAHAQYDIREGVEACLGTAPPCPDPTDLGEIAGDGELRIIRASINPPGRDERDAYNKEWVDLMLLEDTNLNGYVVQHTINPGTASEVLRRYYQFQGTGSLATGTIIRIHSGAAAGDPAPTPGIIHRYVADPGEVGNWRLNNRRDTIRVLDADGAVVDTQSFLAGSFLPLSAGPVYLVACPGEEETCAQAAVPAACQPPGGAYEYSRVCETYDLKIRCDLPPSHQDRLSCDDLEAIVCGNQHPPFPVTPTASDNCVVLATIHVLNGTTLSIDDLTDRRLLLSESLLLNYLQCRCDETPTPSSARITSLDPDSIQLERDAVVILDGVIIAGEGLQGAVSVIFADSGIQAFVVSNNDPASVIVDLTVSPNTTVGQQSFVLNFADGRFALDSAIYDIFLQVDAAPPLLPGQINAIIPSVVQGSTNSQVTRTVIINGAGLDDAEEVRFNGSRIQDVTILNNTSTSIALGIVIRSGIGTRRVDFRIAFADGRPELRSQDFGIELTINYLPFIDFGDLRMDNPELILNRNVIANELNVNPDDLDWVALSKHKLNDIHNVGPERRLRFEEAGAQNIIAVATMPVEEIMRIAAVSESQAKGIQNSARQLMLRKQ